MIGDDGAVLAGITDGAEPRSSAARIAALASEPDWSEVEERNTTLVCVMTDAPLDRRACARVARMASGGVARAVDPVFSDVDGDVAFCLASGDAAERRPLPRADGGNGRGDGDGRGDPRLGRRA